MLFVRAAVLLTFFLGTFTIRGLQVAMTSLFSASEAISATLQPEECGYDSDEGAPDRPKSDKVVRISRVPRVAPPKIRLAAVAVQVYVSIGTSLDLQPVARTLSGPAPDASPAFLPQLLAASSAHNRAPPSGLLA
jgi:hypothetical protein